MIQVMSDMEIAIIEAVRSKPQSIASVVKAVFVPSQRDAARTLIRRMVDEGRLKIDQDWNLSL